MFEVRVLREDGYEEAAYGFSLSYNTTIEKAKSLLERYAFGVPGENKFLETMSVTLDINAPRFWWQEYATYRVGITTQSESTMHTLMKRELTQEDFFIPLRERTLHELNSEIRNYKNRLDKTVALVELKNLLPEGFMQRRISKVSYKSFAGMYHQRKSHRSWIWRDFLDGVLSNISHPEFIRKEEK